MSVLVVLCDCNPAVVYAWADHLASQLDSSTIVLMDQALANGASPPESNDRSTQLSVLLGIAEAERIPELVEVVPSAEMVALALDLSTGQDVTHVVVAAPPRRRREGPSVARSLFEKCPHTTILLRVGDNVGSSEKPLVPIIAGTQSRAALRLAAKLVRRQDQDPQRVIRAVSIEPRALTEALGVGQRLLQRAIDNANIDLALVEPHVEIDDHHDTAIARLAEDHDLVVLGASGNGPKHLTLGGRLRSQLWGAVPERLVERSPPVQVALVRDRWSSAARWHHRLDRWMSQLVPQLNRDQRIALSERLQTGSQWNFDFAALITLSTAIAALGLVQSSTAVVIGAMLVAPLMTPILGAGLALIQGNLPLLLSASRSLVLGYLSALSVGLIVGLGFGTADLTAELLARGQPTLLDLAIALLSGIAAAYCIGRPGLLAALPGVAIAAALVPPIATTGIAAASGRSDVAIGAALLFVTNVLAIVVGAFLSLYAVGLRGHINVGLNRPWLRNAVLVGLAALALVAWPLARATFDIRAPSDQAPATQPTLNSNNPWILQQLAEQMPAWPTKETLLVWSQDETQSVPTLTVECASNPPSAPERSRFAKQLAEHLAHPVRVRFAQVNSAAP